MRAVWTLMGALLALVAGLAYVAITRPSPAALVLWAWERPEDLRFAGNEVGVAVLAGTVILAGGAVVARPRLQPALVAQTQRLIGAVHVEIDRSRGVLWTAAQRAAAATAVLHMMASPRFAEVQVDFEVRASERPILLDLLRDVRTGLPPGRLLSMTALASWCDTDAPWLAAAAVDDVVPMLFRMGRGGEALKRRLANGGDLADPHCRHSLGLAVDTPMDRLPPGRRLFLFDPAAWTAGDLATFRRSLG